eukprot:symbB.v1.2.020919.t1/scaffold1786.1/size101393/2
MEYKQRSMQEQMQHRLYEQKVRQHDLREKMHKKIQDVQKKGANAPPMPTPPMAMNAMAMTPPTDFGQHPTMY